MSCSAGGNVKKLKELPPGCRAGDNANAFLGGFRLWKHARKPRAAVQEPLVAGLASAAVSTSKENAAWRRTNR